MRPEEEAGRVAGAVVAILALLASIRRPPRRPRHSTIFIDAHRARLQGRGRAT